LLETIAFMEPASNPHSSPHVTETWVTAPRRPVAKVAQACLVHIYPTGPSMGMRYALGHDPVVVGRGDDCDIRITDHSVSRRHARVEFTEHGYSASDLQSTNGTFVNDEPTTIRDLRDGDYLRIGNCIFRFLAGGNVESEYHEEIYRLTIIDALTGIHNKRLLLDFLEREVARSSRHLRPISVVMFDIDHFKGVNDEVGHLGGDYTLREIANMIRSGIRREDLFARYGGEEFVVALVETTSQGAQDLGERLRKMIEDHPFVFDEKRYQVTISVGIASTLGNEGLKPDDLIHRAEEKLIEAKIAGRNRVAL
jgi:two-component system cell cycle response regulator